MISTKGHYRLILADVGSFNDATDAFVALDSGNRDKIRDVIEQDNIITDYAYYGFTGCTPRIPLTNPDQYCLQPAIRAFSELSICSGTYDPSYDYRKAQSYSDAGLTELGVINSPTIVDDISNMKRTLTGTFSSPVSNRTINAVCSVSSVQGSNFPASILWLTTPVTQTTSTTLFIQYMITFAFSSDTTGYNTLANAYLQTHMNGHMADSTNNSFNMGFIVSGSSYPTVMTAMTPLKPAINKLNVRHAQQSIVYMQAQVPNTQNSSGSDFARWRVGGAVSYGSSSASENYAHSRTNITYHNRRTYTNYSLRVVDTAMLGYSDIGSSFVHTDVMKHSVSESNLYPQLDAVPPPTSVATVDMATTATSVDFPRALDIAITRSGEANQVPDGSTAQATIKYTMPDYNMSVESTFIPVQNFPDSTEPVYNGTYVKNTILDMFTVGDYVYYLFNNASSDATANAYLCKWLKNTIENGEGIINVGVCYSGVVVGTEIWLATSTGLSIFDTGTGTITSTLTTTNGLVENRCVYVDRIGASIYVYHTSSISILSGAKMVTNTLASSTLNPTTVIPFRCGVPKVIDGVVIWGEISAHNFSYIGNTSSPITVSIYNTGTNSATSIQINGSNNGGLFAKPRVMHAWKNTNTTIKIFVLYAYGNTSAQEYQILDYDMVSGVISAEPAQTYTTRTTISYPSGGTAYTTGIDGAVNGTLDTPTSIVLYTRSYNLGVSIVTTISKADFTYTMAFYNYVNQPGVSADWYISGTDIAFVSGNQKLITYLSGNNPVVLNGELASAATMYVDPSTGALSGSPVVFNVSTLPYTNLPDNFTFTFSNTTGFSSSAQLIAGERFTMVYMNGSIKKNSQSATYYSYLYLGTLLQHTATITVANNATYTIPEASTVNFRALIDDQTVITSGSTTLQQVTTFTGTNQYMVSLAGVITFSSDLVGASVNVTYYTTNRNG